jgi:pentatricopeptide repeat protein
MAAMAPGTVQLNIFAWNRKLNRYLKDRQPKKAMQLFRQMQEEGMNPDKFTFVQVINACAGLGALDDGRLVHEQLIQSGCESDVFVGNSLIDMYSWGQRGCLPSVQQNAIANCGHLDHYVMGRCEMRSRAERTGTSDKCGRRVCAPTLLPLWGF